MKHATTLTNISKKLSEELLSDKELCDKLLWGNLYDFELEARSMCLDIFNNLMQIVLPVLSERVCQRHRLRYKKAGVKKYRCRMQTIELHTGYRVSVPDLYAKSVKADFSGKRHLLVSYWSIEANCSPLRLSQVSMSSVLSPSYHTANELMSSFGIHQSGSRVRKITQKFAQVCADHEVDLSLTNQESLANKRVVISIDGGRTRTRYYDQCEQATDLRKASYQTPWCEPKLFVIQTLGADGKIDSKSLPIYGVRFGERDILALLKSYLKRLGIEKATSIQLVADGALWIWNQLPALLEELGVEAKRVIETLDYAHAAGYVHKLVDSLPKKVSPTKKKEYRESFLSQLWKGDALGIVAECKKLFTRPSKEVKTWINYLKKHANRMQYHHFKANKQLCGSGIVESGIRRIISLRFKNPSTFWYKDNVESLFFLRAVCLSKRWNILIKNFVSFEYY